MMRLCSLSTPFQTLSLLPSLAAFDGQTKVRYIRIPVKGGYIVVKIVTQKRRKRFDAEIRKIRDRKNIKESRIRYVNLLFYYKFDNRTFSVLFADDEKSDQQFRVIDVETGFVQKLFVDSREYTLTVEGVLRPRSRRTTSRLWMATSTRRPHWAFRRRFRRFVLLILSSQ